MDEWETLVAEGDPRAHLVPKGGLAHELSPDCDCHPAEGQDMTTRPFQPVYVHFER